MSFRAEALGKKSMVGETRIGLSAGGGVSAGLVVGVGGMYFRICGLGT